MKCDTGFLRNWIKFISNYNCDKKEGGQKIPVLDERKGVNPGGSKKVWTTSRSVKICNLFIYVPLELTKLAKT